MFISLLLAMLIQPATAPASQPDRMSPEVALQAIDRFLADPKPGDDFQTIVQFAQESNDVEVHVDHLIAPWLGKKPAYPTESAFVVSFIAGNVKAQLTSHTKGDAPYPGLLAVISAYQKMRAGNTTIPIPEIEQLADLEKKGELKAHVEKVLQEREKLKKAAQSEEEK